MNIIFVANQMAKPRTIAFWQVLVALVSIIVVSIFLTIYFIAPTNASNSAEEVVFVEKAKPNVANVNEPQKHLDAFALMLGEMQARIARLDAQTERLTLLAGDSKAIKQNMAALKAQRQHTGGPLLLEAPQSEALLKKNIDKLLSSIEYQTEYLDSLEAALLQQSVYKDMLPNSSPVVAAYRSSSYGWRIDPFNNRRAFHSGLDFTADSGTPIYAAADGVVKFASRHAGYGKLVKIDHGSGLETRYAHASKILVKPGERIAKGQMIAKVGSTGRSTGPHLHYEIRLNGVALDPRKYLKR